jgi:hypothetical protein
LLRGLGKHFNVYPSEIRKPTRQQMLLNVARELELAFLDLPRTRLGRLAQRLDSLAPQPGDWSAWLQRLSLALQRRPGGKP